MTPNPKGKKAVAPAPAEPSGAAAGVVLAPRPALVEPVRPHEVVRNALPSMRLAGEHRLAVRPPEGPLSPLRSAFEPTSGSNSAGGLVPGSKFGVYLVGPCIGEGGMARIYRAEHAGLRRQVALKVLIDGFARDPDGRERFLREARIAASVKHPNVVNIFDVGVHEDIPYLVMELLEGQDLEELLKTRGGLDEHLIVDIMVPIVAGLQAVHDAGIVHRDLKPGNIFLSRGRYNDIEAKLLDFGISKAPGHEQLRLTTNRTLMGTPFYISPEGLHGHEMTALSDQYSLAVVMYECATGFTPYAASTFAELFKLITAGQYARACERKPEISKPLSRIIERAMSLDPQTRYVDLREMGRDLLGLAGQRTRITWGLSFGDIKYALPALSEGRLSTSQAVSEPPPSRRKRAAIAALGVAPFLLLGTWLAHDYSSRIALPPPPGGPPPSVVQAPQEGLAGGHPPSLPSLGPVENVTLPVPAGALALEPPSSGPAAPLARAKSADGFSGPPAEHDSHAPVASAPPVPPVYVYRRPAAPRPVAVVAPIASASAATPVAAPVEPDPEWALPPADSAAQSRPAPTTGANRAPIFD